MNYFPYSQISQDEVMLSLIFIRSPYKSGQPVCTLAKAQAGASTWNVLQHPISYCLVEEVQQECRLQFSLTIMIIVILANATKASIMFLTWWKFSTPTLVTMGDAITSFLDNPDQTTAGVCLASKRDILNANGPWKDRGAKRWVPKRHFWFRAASVSHTVHNFFCEYCVVAEIAKSSFSVKYLVPRHLQYSQIFLLEKNAMLTPRFCRSKDG